MMRRTRTMTVFPAPDPLRPRTGRGGPAVTRHFSSASNPPAATAVPMTPATFGPIACISR